jgi:hypothetical protein
MITHAPKATNYGQARSGGDTYSMGEMLNEELRYAWQTMRRMDTETWYWQAMHDRVKALCRIRKAGRVGL